MSAPKKNCFATVGSTSFAELIETLLSDQALQSLHQKGFTKLILQYGAGQIEGLPDEGASTFTKNGIDVILTLIKNAIQIEYFRYKPSIVDEMRNADLIIGHAGAGTCLESLKLGKPLIVVINEKLMGNHQSELAEKLSEMGHVLCSTPSTLNEVLKSDKMFHLKPFNSNEKGDFGHFLDIKLGLKTQLLDKFVMFDCYKCLCVNFFCTK